MRIHYGVMCWVIVNQQGKGTWLRWSPELWLADGLKPDSVLSAGEAEMTKKKLPASGLVGGQTVLSPRDAE